MIIRLTPRNKALIALHITVFLWGITAILGKLISYSSLTLVWHRMSITFIVYLLFPSFWRQVKLLSWLNMCKFFGIGLIVCAHWIFFYASIKIADSASITLACMGSISFFSSIIEPLLMNKPYSILDIGLGLIVIIGILFIYFSLPKDNDTHSNSIANPQLAIITGLIASFLSSLFCVLNKRLIDLTSPLVMSGLGSYTHAYWIALHVLLYTLILALTITRTLYCIMLYYRTYILCTYDILSYKLVFTTHILYFTQKWVPAQCL